MGYLLCEAFLAMQEDNCCKKKWKLISISASKRIRRGFNIAHPHGSCWTRERTKTTCCSRHFEITAGQINSHVTRVKLAGKFYKMAALSARCVRSLARASAQISVSYLDQHAKKWNMQRPNVEFIYFSQKTALSTNGVSQSKFLILNICFYVLFAVNEELCNINIKLTCPNRFSYSCFTARSISSALGKSILRDCGL